MRILLVEDDVEISRQICRAFEESGFLVETAMDGEDGWFRGDSETWDAVILDLGLPEMDGISILKRWRQAGQQCPVMILTARGSWTEKVEGLNAGADDYLAKPFQMEEAIARVRALIRRSSGHASPALSCGPVVVDTRTNRVTVDGQHIVLTAQEYRVLSYLMHHKGRAVSRPELTEHIYAQDFERDSNTIEVFVGRLRKKLGTPIIRTVRGIGYQIEDGE